MVRVNCSCCARQMVPDVLIPDEYVTKAEGARLIGHGIWACGVCARDLDADGYFPEERALLESRGLL